MHDSNRTANLLGATALAVTDLALTGATKAAGTSASGSAALVVLSASPGLSVTELGRRVGLSQPAAARMVDSLEAGGLVERRPGPGRWVSVTPTAAGTRTARTMLAARGTPLNQIVDVLDEAERERLDALLAKLLTRLYAEVGNADLLCRLCDREGCVHDGAVCPVGQAERDEQREQHGGRQREQQGGGRRSGAGAAPRPD
ncbi:MarR family winged helix-turn-helix transcriptional regulator [Streptomyces sp. WMMB 322]|uniref:MarR family winged helix-turn-helix transcriptional regulator n=1 Tax=Streptomyces sp. WMMB 322 TaxID=1286821 RepID=UPI000823DBD8|nr:MarR family transcriptional regulator [Streptomyces sp. WMMB 322]SCK36295.1 transcriptional regulator, MarR family [Streptomyces sp. WMMB 322]